MTSTLIGHTGMIGQTLLDQHRFDLCYNSSNIDSFNECAHDLVVCSAPSGNRLLVNSDPKADNCNLENLITILSQSAIKHFVLISSVTSLIMDSLHLWRHGWIRLPKARRNGRRYYAIHGHRTRSVMRL